MKICYAYRRTIFYPYDGGSRGLPEDRKTRERLFRSMHDIGFDAVELSFDASGGMEATEQEVKDLRKELADYGISCAGVRAGGGLYVPRVMAENKRTLMKAVDNAYWVGAEVLNCAIGTPPRNVSLGGLSIGEGFVQGASKTATAEDFERTGAGIHDVAEKAAGYGLDVTLEVHQHTLVDNSWSVKHVIELADSPNVYVNPDLGNILWNYNHPEETMEEAILELAPVSKYWHCKNMHRVYVPELDRSFFIRVPLPDGEIDYRFAISAMDAAGFDGWLAVEGATEGDQLTADKRSLDYVKDILAGLE